MKPIRYHKSDGFFWIRIFGRGLLVKDTRKSPLLFSQRNGYTKNIMVGKWYIGYLKPMNLNS